MKKILLIQIIIGGLLLITSKILIWSDQYQICRVNDLDCLYLYAFALGHPLFYLSLGYLVALLLCLLFRTSNVRLLIYIPAYFAIAYLLVWFVPIYCSDDFYCFDKKIVSQILAGLGVIGTFAYLLCTRYRA